MGKVKLENIMETTSQLTSLECYENAILKPCKGYYKSNDRIYLNHTEDTEDGTWPRVQDYIKFCNKVNDFDTKAMQNFIVGKNKKADYGDFIIHKTDVQYSNDGIRIVFKNPQLVSFGNVGEKEITEPVKEITGKLSHDFYWLKNGRQNKIANGIEIFIEELEFKS